MSALDTILAKLASLFEDPTGLERPLWRDYSRYQEIVNFDVAKSNGVLGMFARAGISWGYTDPWFHTNWGAAGEAGMYRSSYHVLYPSEPVAKQAENWFRIHPTIDVIPRAIDLELGQNQLWATIANKTWEMSERVADHDGVRPIIYTRYLLANQWLSSWTTEMLNEHYWWLAQYLYDRRREHAGPPTLPNRINRNRVLLHQTADKKVAPAGEVTGSIAVDWDRWEIGNETQMRQWIAAAWGGPVEPPEPPPPPEFEPYSVRITADVLNIREQADAASADLGELLKGSVVPISVERGDWLKLRGWIHKKWTQKE